jgi:hypothetical protein
MSTPAKVADEDIWRAAHLMIKQHGDNAAMEAAMRSNAALELGDMFNYELWLRVVMAIQSGKFGNASKGGEVVH